MKFKLFNVFEVFFRLLLIFFIYFVWVRYFFDSLLIAILITSFLTLTTDYILKIFQDKRQLKLKLKEEELKQIETYNNTFVFNDDKYAVDFFYKLAKTKHNATKKKDYVLIEHSNGEKIALFPFFTYRKFSTDDLIFVFNKVKSSSISRLVICVSELEPDAQKFASLLSVETIILNKSQVYLKLLKEYNCFPEEKNTIAIKPAQENKIKKILAFSLNRKRTKAYFFSSLVLLVSSLIIRHNIYYIIMASILLLLSLASFISPKFTKQVPENLLNENSLNEN